jgi:hypothetical protein
VGHIIEIHEVSGAYIDRTDTEAHRRRIDQVKVHKPLEGRFQRGGVVVTDRGQGTLRLQEGRRHARVEKPWGAAQ